MNVEKESIFFCLRFFPAYLILKPGSDFGEEVIRSKEGAVFHEKQVCLKDRHVVKKNWKKRTLRRIIGVDST